MSTEPIANPSTTPYHAHLAAALSHTLASLAASAPPPHKEDGEGKKGECQHGHEEVTALMAALKVV